MTNKTKAEIQAELKEAQEANRQAGISMSEMQEKLKEMERELEQAKAAQSAPMPVGDMEQVYLIRTKEITYNGKHMGINFVNGIAIVPVKSPGIAWGSDGSFKLEEDALPLQKAVYRLLTDYDGYTVTRLDHEGIQALSNQGPDAAQQVAAAKILAMQGN